MTQQARSALSGVAMTPLWLDRPDAPDLRPPLETATRCDLLIVGGGFTGLWAGIQAKEQNPGLDVVLIEADKVAHGASGRPGGVVSTSVMHGLSNAARIFPGDIRELERLGHDNMRGFLDTVTRHGIDCHAEWGGELTVAVDPAHVPALSAEHRLHLEHGHDSTLLDREGVRAEIASPRYFGGIWSKDVSGTVHPALLAWGLKRAALALGVRLHEGTRLVRLADDGATLTAETSTGAKVKAPKVLLATNAFAEGDRRIRRRVVAVRDRVLATEPLGEAQMQAIGWRHRQGVYDTRTQMNYMRLTKDNRIVFGGRLAYAYGGAIAPAVDRQSTPTCRWPPPSSPPSRNSRECASPMPGAGRSTSPRAWPCISSATTAARPCMPAAIRASASLPRASARASASTYWTARSCRKAGSTSPPRCRRSCRRSRCVGWARRSPCTRSTRPTTRAAGAGRG